MSYRIASWNVNSVKARLAHAQTFLSKTIPDVLFLQEIKGETLPEISAEYHAVYKGQKTYNGVAILSRIPVTPILQNLPGDNLDEQARYLEVEWQNMRLINIYLPNGNPVETEKFSYKINWLNRFITRLDELRSSRIPFLIGGDFNIIPEDKDCYDPEIWKKDALYHPEIVKKFRSIINLGLTDAFRVFNQAPDTYTFWDYQAGAWPRNRGVRIDHFLTSPAITDRLISCTIDKTPRGWDTPSDHTPIIVEISE